MAFRKREKKSAKVGNCRMCLGSYRQYEFAGVITTEGVKKD